MLKEKDEVIYISFNQDQTYFAVATQKGFKIFKLDEEIELAINRDFGAGIGIIEMIHKTNIFAMVGGGQTPRHPKNKLMIWDDCTYSLLSTGQVYHRNQLQVRSQSHQNQSRTLYHSPLNQNFRLQISRLQSTRRHRNLP